jgi:hypothetical protein
MAGKVGQVIRSACAPPALLLPAAGPALPLLRLHQRQPSLQFLLAAAPALPSAGERDQIVSPLLTIVGKLNLEAGSCAGIAGESW